MARVTVEDCVDKIPNRFELVMMASQRARGISAGAQLTVDRDNDKNPVVSLREIAEDTVSPEELTEELIKSLQTFVAIDEPEEEDADLLGINREDSVDYNDRSASVSSLSNKNNDEKSETDTDKAEDPVVVIGSNE